MNIANENLTKKENNKKKTKRKTKNNSNNNKTKTIKRFADEAKYMIPLLYRTSRSFPENDY